MLSFVLIVFIDRGTLNVSKEGISCFGKSCITLYVCKNPFDSTLNDSRHKRYLKNYPVSLSSGLVVQLSLLSSTPSLTPTRSVPYPLLYFFDFGDSVLSGLKRQNDS